MSQYIFKAPANDEILLITPEGDVRINWPIVEAHANKWGPGCTDIHIGYCLALIAVKKGQS